MNSPLRTCTIYWGEKQIAKWTENHSCSKYYMFYESTNHENLSTSEAIKEVTLEEVTYGAGRGGAFCPTHSGHLSIKNHWHQRMPHNTRKLDFSQQVLRGVIKPQKAELAASTRTPMLTQRRPPTPGALGELAKLGRKFSNGQFILRSPKTLSCSAPGEKEL